MRSPTEEEREDARIEVIERRLEREGKCLKCGKKKYNGGGQNPHVDYCECKAEPPRKFYKTIIQVEVLSKEPLNAIDHITLEYIAQEVVTGEWSGAWEITSCQEISGVKFVKAVKKQGSDPEFFGLDEDGNDLED